MFPYFCSAEYSYDFFLFVFRKNKTIPHNRGPTFLFLTLFIIILYASSSIHILHFLSFLLVSRACFLEQS